MCRHHGSKLFPIPSVLVINSLYKQFMKYHICDRGTLGMITCCNFLVVAIEYFQETEVVYWPQYTESPWWSILACKLNLYKPNVIFRFKDTKLYFINWLSIWLKRLTMKTRYLGDCKIYLQRVWQVSFLQRKHNFFQYFQSIFQPCITHH